MHRIRSNASDTQLRELMQFFFDHGSIVAYHTRTFHVRDGREIHIPAIVSDLSPTKLYNLYTIFAHDKELRFSRSLFFRLWSLFIDSRQRSRAALASPLVENSSNLQTLEKLIKDLATRYPVYSLKMASWIQVCSFVIILS